MGYRLLRRSRCCFLTHFSTIHYHAFVKTFWEKGPDYCRVTAYEVVVGSNPGGSGHTDNAGACSHADFLKGQYQDLIRRNLGEDVLHEVIAAVKAMAQDPTFEQQRDEDAGYVVAWEKIPLNLLLKEWAAHPHDRAMDHYAKEADHSTVLNLSTGATLRLPFESDQGTLVLEDGTVAVIPERSGPVLEHKGFFYNGDIHLTVYDFFGKRRFSTRDLEKSHGFGKDYRVVDVLRVDDHILAVYRTLMNPLLSVVKQVMGERGYLEIDPLKGIVSRCPMQ